MGRGALLLSPEQGASCEEVLGMPGVKAGLGRRAGELLFPLSKRTAGTVERGMEMASGQCGTCSEPSAQQRSALQKSGLVPVGTCLPFYSPEDGY